MHILAEHVNYLGYIEVGERVGPIGGLPIDKQKPGMPRFADVASLAASPT